MPKILRQMLLFSAMITTSTAASIPPTNIPEDWTGVEKYAWQEILAGQEVELSRQAESNGIKVAFET